MRRRGHQLLGLGLSLCLILGSAGIPSAVGYAADTTVENMAEAPMADQTEPAQDDRVQEDAAESDVQNTETKTETVPDETQTEETRGRRQARQQMPHRETETEATRSGGDSDRRDTKDRGEPGDRSGGCGAEELKENSFPVSERRTDSPGSDLFQSGVLSVCLGEGQREIYEQYWTGD